MKWEEKDYSINGPGNTEKSSKLKINKIRSLLFALNFDKFGCIKI